MGGKQIVLRLFFSVSENLRAPLDPLVKIGCVTKLPRRRKLCGARNATRKSCHQQSDAC